MLSVLDLVRQIETGALKPADVIERCAKAIAAREGEIGAFTALDIDGARNKAAKAKGPLWGLPVGVKDIIDTADLPTAYGSPIYSGHHPVADAPVVSMIKRAGGVILGKTVSTPFANRDPAGTRNPVNPAHTPGGSSSGSAAAVAAGMVPIAIGTQTAGSVIRPGAFCGVAAFKPSYKIIPTVGIKAFSPYLDTVGLFAASIADVAFAAAAVTGRALRVDQGSPATPRIGLARTHIWNDASADMRQAVERAARISEKAGAQVRDVALPKICEEAYTAHRTIQDYEGFQALAFEFDNHYDRLPPILRALLEDARTLSAEDYDDARRIASHARRALKDALGDFDVLLTPSAESAAPHGLASTGSPAFNKFWTLIGTPCVNVPGQRDAMGLPLGVQVIARFGKDHAALEAAWFLERAMRDAA